MTVATGSWTWLSGAGGAGAPGRQLLLLAWVAAAYAAGRVASARAGAVPAIASTLAAGIGLAVLTSPGALSGEALAGPLGYGNANGALCVLGAGAALLAGLSFSEPGPRALGLVAGSGLAVLAALTASRAAAVLATALVLLGALLLARPSRGRGVPVLGALLVMLALTTTVGLAVLQSAGSTAGAAALSERRLTLWSEALELVEREPVTGVGPGRFAVESPTAVADADARWAHSLWLQQAAETGLPGLVLLMASAGTVLLRVRADGWEDGGVPAMGAAATTALLVQASIDYVAHFPAVVLGTALLAGLSAVRRPVR